MNDKVLKIGIIGCGGIGNSKHLPALKTVPNVEVVAFCDIVLERAQKSAEKFGTPDAKVYEDYKELLKDESIDIVHVCTPNRSHSFISIDALEAGKHVMCEKPMAKTYKEALAMCEAAERTGKKLTIGYQNRQTEENLYVKACAENGEFGEIYYGKALAIRRRAVPTWGVFLNEYEQGGGPLIDIGTHALDMTLWVMDNYEPEMVVGKTHKKLEHPEAGNIWGDNGVSTTPLEEAACGMIVMKNGATILLETSWALNIADPREATCTLCGSKAGLDFKDGKLRINKVEMNRQVLTEVNTDAGGVAFYDGANMSAPEYEARQWIDAVINDTQPTVLPRQALVVSQILEAIYTSSETGKPVYFE